MALAPTVPDSRRSQGPWLNCTATTRRSRFVLAAHSNRILSSRHSCAITDRPGSPCSIASSNATSTAFTLPPHPESASPPGPARGDSRRSANQRADRPAGDELSDGSLRTLEATPRPSATRPWHEPSKSVRPSKGSIETIEIKPPSPAGRLLVTLVFLVPRASSTAFLSAVEAASHPVSGHLLATGPWPPYHFTSPTLGAGIVSPLMRS